MKKTTQLLLTFAFQLVSLACFAQATSIPAEISTTYATKIGVTPELRDLVEMPGLSPEKKKLRKRQKKTVTNFIGRGHTVATNPNAKPKYGDPVRQYGSSHSPSTAIEPLINIDGMAGDIGATPPDPCGDIGENYYIQMINVTFFQVFDKEGVAITDPISANTLWSSIGFSSAGDPIILYDQENDRWIITEFPSGNQLLLAISETSDPMGSWMAYNFGTPNFPDYPKWSIWPNAICVTTNEGGPNNLPSYFINRADLLAGEETVSIQRINIPGIPTGPGFFVATPVDWTGDVMPPANADPMILRLNDDAWGAADEDLIDVFTVTIDWDDENNTAVTQLEVPTAPFDTDACATSGPNFACIPQPNGQGIDGLPEVIMHQVHYRNFGTHESMVLNFLVNVSDTEILAGIRWMELRRTSESDWFVYQEGTYSPDDRVHRFMGSICMDRQGNIALAYSTSGDDDSPGLRFTGRRVTDSLGVMTFDEGIITDGFSNSPGGRYGDYAQLTIDPVNDRTFWFTSEYRAVNDYGTRIVAFELFRDTIDISPVVLINPQSASDLTAAETVQLEIRNNGLDTVSAFNVGYILDNGAEVKDSVTLVLAPEDTYVHTFSATADLSTIGDYQFKLFTDLDTDQALFNDTIRVTVTNIPRVDAGVTEIDANDGIICSDSTDIAAVLTNLGTDTLFSADVIFTLDGVVIDTISWTGILLSGESTPISLSLTNLPSGTLENLRRK